MGGGCMPPRGGELPSPDVASGPSVAHARPLWACSLQPPWCTVRWRCPQLNLQLLMSPPPSTRLCTHTAPGPARAARAKQHPLRHLRRAALVLGVLGG